MTKRRVITLVGGITVLGAISWWRLGSTDGPPLPAKPARVAALNSLAADEKAGFVSFSGKTMGTTYTVKYVPPHPGVLGMPEAAVEGALSAVNEAMSTYDPKSELSALNRAPANQLLPVSPELMEVLRLSADTHAATRGAFDITVHPLVNLYGFGANAKDSPPEKEEVVAVRERVGLHLVEISKSANTFRKLRDGVEMDLGGIAKGYGVDRAALALEDLGVHDYMVEVGGEIRVKGAKKDRVPWTLAIEEPTSKARKVHATLELPSAGAALATSGDYRSFRKIDGRTVSHTFDPRTFAPVPRRTASVSVIRPTAAEADALATALSVLSPDEAIDVANERGWAVYLLLHPSEPETERGPTAGGFTPRKSRAFETLRFQVQNP